MAEVIAFDEFVRRAERLGKSFIPSRRRGIEEEMRAALDSLQMYVRVSAEVSSANRVTFFGLDDSLEPLRTACDKAQSSLRAAAQAAAAAL